MRCNYCEMIWYRFTTIDFFFSFHYIRLLSISTCFRPRYWSTSDDLIVHDLTVAFLFFLFSCDVLVTLLCGFSYKPVPILKMLPFDRCMPHQSSADIWPRQVWSMARSDSTVSSETDRKNVMANWYQTNCTSISTATTRLYTNTLPIFTFFASVSFFLVFLPFLLLFFFLPVVFVCPYCTFFCFALARSALGSLEYWVIIL